MERVSKRLPLLGWVSVGRGALALLPQVRALEAQAWGLPGWCFTRYDLRPGAVTVTLEGDST